MLEIPHFQALAVNEGDVNGQLRQRRARAFSQRQYLGKSSFVHVCEYQCVRKVLLLLQVVVAQSHLQR